MKGMTGACCGTAGSMQRREEVDSGARRERSDWLSGFGEGEEPASVMEDDKMIGE